MNDIDAKDACQTEITEVQQYAYRNCLSRIDEVTDVNRPFIQHVKDVTTLLQIKSMNKLIELHPHYLFDSPLEEYENKLLPDGLQALTFGLRFNQPLEKDGKTLLPDGL